MNQSSSESVCVVAEMIFRRALADCGVEHAFASRADYRSPEKPYTMTFRGSIDENPIEIDLAQTRRVLVVAAGKASATMLQGLLKRIRMPAECELSGVLIAPSRPEGLPSEIRYFAGGHPTPNQDSLSGAAAVLSLLEETTATAASVPTFCFFLISGGASAMMELPLAPSISLEDVIAFHFELVHSGASIEEINCVRKHFSAVKGGRLGQLAASLPNVTVLVSDVPSGLLDALASGPTLPDSSTVAMCRDILTRFHLLDRFPAPVRRFFQSSSLPETPKPGCYSSRVVTLLSSDDLAEAARVHAEALGYEVLIDNSCDDWDYRRAADYLLERAREMKKQHARVCLISTGEVTVQFSTPTEKDRQVSGGRNQHFVLYAAFRLTPADGDLAICSVGSDGIDGNSRFAGAVLDFKRFNSTLPGVSRQDALDALAHFDSSTYLQRLQATIETGPTGNNLRDLRIFLFGGTPAVANR